MFIYTIEPGDSLYEIARRYETTVEKLAHDNQIEDPLSLVIGQAIVIVTDHNTHIIKEGETLFLIAKEYQTTVDDILAANPIITDLDQVYEGQIIVLPSNDMPKRNIETNGFTLNLTNPPSDEVLSNLTYISPFSYQANAQGVLRPINDSAIIAAGAQKNVAALMCITNLDDSRGFSSDIAHELLTNQQAQDALIENVLNTLRERQYFGLIIDFEYIYPDDRESYNAFLRKIQPKLRDSSFLMLTAVAPKTSAEQVGTLYEAHDYAVHGEVCDFVIIMTYEWGYTYGPAMAVAPIKPVKSVLDYAVSVIPPKKIMMGMPNYGYNWTLPFVQGTAARVITNTGAISLASQVGAEIEYDEVQQSPFFNYYDTQKKLHEVWFDDARSVQARLQLLNEYKLAGISYWTIDNLFRQGFLVLQDMFYVQRVM